MFDKATMRFFAGMLFGSVAGVFLGIGYAAAATSHLPDLDEVVKMNDLLWHVMRGSFFGLFFGGLVGLARRPLATAFVCALLGSLGMFLTILAFGPALEARLSRLMLGAGIMVAAALAVEIVARILTRSATSETNP